MIKINRNNLFSSEKVTIQTAYDLFLKFRESMCSKATIDIYKFQRKQIADPLWFGIV